MLELFLGRWWALFSSRWTSLGLETVRQHARFASRRFFDARIVKLYDFEKRKISRMRKRLCCSKIVPKAGLDLGSGSEARVLLGLAPKNWLTNRRFKHYNLDHSNKSFLFKYLTNDTSLLESIESTGLKSELEVFFFFKFWKIFSNPRSSSTQPWQSSTRWRSWNVKGALRINWTPLAPLAAQWTL